MSKQSSGGEAPRRRGRPAVDSATALDRDAVLDQALAIIRDEGVDGLSMRRLAADLGVTPMSIYHYVANKPALLDALIERTWRQIIDDFTADDTDLIEWVLAMGVRTREVWLENAGLANLALAVAEPDDSFFANTLLSAQIMEAVGFPDPVLAYSTIQTFIMGSISVAANRRFASRYFGRDPAEVLRRAEAMLEGHNASPEHRGIVHARFEEGDTANFERGMRALIRGLLDPPT